MPSGQPALYPIDLLISSVIFLASPNSIIGTRARIAEVLDRKRGLSIAMIRRLNAELGIPAETLIRQSLQKAAV